MTEEIIIDECFNCKKKRNMGDTWRTCKLKCSYKYKRKENDYITRLEQENEKLKKEVKQIGSDFIKKGDYARELEKENKSLYEEKNCLHKIIDRLLENAGYLKDIASAEDFEDVYEDMQIKQNELNDYRSALEEIQKAIKSYGLTVDNGASIDTLYTIRKIINEVLE